METAASVNHAGDAEAVEFAHEEPRRVQLIFARELRPFGERGIEDRRIGLGDEQSRRVALSIALDLAAWRVGRVACVADGPERRAVQKCATVEVQNEDWRVGGGGVDLVERGHPALGELEFAPATDYSHPLRRRRAFGLLMQQAQRVGQAGHAVPPEFHVVTEAAANWVHV